MLCRAFLRLYWKWWRLGPDFTRAKFEGPLRAEICLRNSHSCFGMFVHGIAFSNYSVILVWPQHPNVELEFLGWTVKTYCDPMLSQFMGIQCDQLRIS